MAKAASIGAEKDGTSARGRTDVITGWGSSCVHRCISRQARKGRTRTKARGDRDTRPKTVSREQQMMHRGTEGGEGTGAYMK